MVTIGDKRGKVICDIEEFANYVKSEWNRYIPNKLYSKTEIATLSNKPKRYIQVITECYMPIENQNPGRGKWRKYNKKEVIKIMMLSELQNIGMDIQGALRIISRTT